jgi:hypothetical protein
MDIRSLNDVQKQLFERIIQKLIARNQCTPSDISNTQTLLESIRDTKNLHMIMEKLKECGQIELDNFDESFKEGINFISLIFFANSQWSDGNNSSKF